MRCASGAGAGNGAWMDGYERFGFRGAACGAFGWHFDVVDGFVCFVKGDALIVLL